MFTKFNMNFFYINMKILFVILNYEVCSISFAKKVLRLQDVSALYFFSKNSERILFIIHFPEFFLAPLSQHRVELSKYKADTFDMIQNVLEENTICNGAADKVARFEKWQRFGQHLLQRGLEKRY